MKDNKLIAEFMGYVTHYPAYQECLQFKDENGFWNDADVFETSWDWLMPVVQKCRLDGQNLVGIDNWSEIGSALDECNLDKTYKAVVEFIKEYNDGCHQTYNDERQ
jgi:hypothetical protein